MRLEDLPEIQLSPLPESSFGGRLQIADGTDLGTLISTLEQCPGLMSDALNRYDGLLQVPGLTQITAQPEFLVRLSYLFGSEVEDIGKTLTPKSRQHERVPEILVLADYPPSNRQPPARPDPPLTTDGGLPISFPHRRGWHTDQSFRRPPPDVSLLYSVTPPARGQGQTLFASGIAAYEALSDDMRQRIDGLYGIHALFRTGRSEAAVKAGDQPLPLLPHQASQRQPVVREHPDTGSKALFLCEGGQMDWLIGPFEGMEPGPYGDAAALLYELMAHYTSPRFVYTQEWGTGDLMIYDNRSLIHCGCWYDAQRKSRLMWRTTAQGNPGAEYAGEGKSWIPADGVTEMAGLEKITTR